MIYKYEINNRGHVWKLNDGGEIDIFAYNPHDPHNGPLCIICGYGFCHHCNDEPQKDCTVIEAEFFVIENTKLLG